MNRDDFIDLLARLVTDGELSEAEASDLLRQFDAGTLADSWELPMPVREAIRKHDDRSIEEALALLLLFIGQRLPATRNQLRLFPQNTARVLADGLQAQF